MPSWCMYKIWEKFMSQLTIYKHHMMVSDHFLNAELLYWPTSNPSEVYNLLNIKIASKEQKSMNKRPATGHL